MPATPRALSVCSPAYGSQARQPAYAIHRIRRDAGRGGAGWAAAVMTRCRCPQRTQTTVRRQASAVATNSAPARVSPSRSPNRSQPDWPPRSLTVPSMTSWQRSSSSQQLPIRQRPATIHNEPATRRRGSRRPHRWMVASAMTVPVSSSTAPGTAAPGSPARWRCPANAPVPTAAPRTPDTAAAAGGAHRGHCWLCLMRTASTTPSVTRLSRTQTPLSGVRGAEYEPWLSPADHWSSCCVSRLDLSEAEESLTTCLGWGCRPPIGLASVPMRVERRCDG